MFYFVSDLWRSSDFILSPFPSFLSIVFNPDIVFYKFLGFEMLILANMRFITSVYMMIRPELREDWLTTGDIEAEVEDAQPQENALRAMTHYYNVRRYPEEMAETGRGELEEGEVRWFRRLLEEMSLSQA
jgi:hypothetical protein